LGSDGLYYVVFVLMREEALRRMLDKVTKCCVDGRICLPVPCINQPKVLVTSEDCYVIVTGNICVNRMTGLLEGSNLKML